MSRRAVIPSSSRQYRRWCRNGVWQGAWSRPAEARERSAALKQREGEEIASASPWADHWGLTLCDDGSCSWCQRMDSEYRIEELLAGRVYEISTPPLRRRVLEAR